MRPVRPKGQFVTTTRAPSGTGSASKSAVLIAARWAKTAVHPLLVSFPLGMLAVSVIFDVAALASQEAVWSEVARWDLATGIVGGALAGSFTLLHAAALPRGTQAATMAMARALLHLGGLALFTAALVLRTVQRAPVPSTAGLSLSALGLACACGSAWLGTQLAGRLDGGA